MPFFKNLKLDLSNGINTISSFQLIINISSFGYHILFVGIVSIATFMFPMSWFMFVLPITLISVFLGFTAGFQQYFSSKIALVKFILDFLKFLKILRPLITLHLVVFYSINKLYWFFVVFCYGFTVVYVLASRYNFYHKVVLEEHFSDEVIVLLAFLLFLGFFGTYLRMLINFSSIVVSIMRQHCPELLDPLLRVEPADFPPGSNKSIFSFSRHSHNHSHNYPPRPKMSAWGKFGVGIAVGTFAVGSATLYYTRGQTLEIRRQNDLEEVSQGLMTKEEYRKRYPKN